MTYKGCSKRIVPTYRIEYLVDNYISVHNIISISKEIIERTKKHSKFSPTKGSRENGHTHVGTYTS